jgi:GNAT superfamily N-acetyltransferase
MIEIKSIDSQSELNELKTAYFKQSTAPLDGMWHFGFAPMATHFGFYLKNHLVGFCCINEEGYMLQFYLSPDLQKHGKHLFTRLAKQQETTTGKIKGAFVSTAEPHYLSLCLDNSSTFIVNALMYQHSLEKSYKYNKTADMQAVTIEQLAELVEFSATNINAPRQWLKEYYLNLISRNELFGYWNSQELLAAGECRLFDHFQTGYAEVGMIVSKNKRGKGIAKQVLNYLVRHATKQGLSIICSTESQNISAQKAISDVGFISNHRVVQFEFNQK